MIDATGTRLYFMTVLHSPSAGLGQRDPDRKGDWNQSFNGGRLYPNDPRPEDLDIATIAHVLSQVNRWAGHTVKPFSVAQHSVLVSLACDPEDALWGLLHDVPEFAMGDITRPFKYQDWMKPYRETEADFMRVVCQRFGLPPDQPTSVSRADNMVCATEARDLFTTIDPEWKSRWVDPTPKLTEPIIPWAADIAERAFLARFYSLGGK